MDATSELIIRVGAALGVFAVMALWELLAPRRAWSVGRAPRWPSNLGILLLDAALVRLLFPVAAVGMGGNARAARGGVLESTPRPPVARGLVRVRVRFLGAQLGYYVTPPGL